MRKPLYLDANAHIPINPIALEAYSSFNNTLAGHGHPLSASVQGRAAATVIEESRAKIARLIGAESSGQIIFTSGATQACEWAVNMLAETDKGNYLLQDVFTMSPVEHPAIYMAVNEKIGDPELVHKFPVDESGKIILSQDPDHHYYKSICVHVQNEIGVIQPIKELGLVTSCCLLSDMSQSLGKIPVNVQELFVDIAISGCHKFGAPSGVGFIYMSDPDYWVEFGTGSRYMIDQAGTPNVSGIYASAIALEQAVLTLPERTQKMLSFRSALELGLEQLGFEIIGKAVERCPNVTFARIPITKYHMTAITIMDKLAEKQIYCGLGSACGSLYTGGSSLMQSLGRPSDGQDYLRLSQWGEYTDKDALLVLKAIEGIL